MTEFIINSEQLERLIEAIEHDTGREINRVVIDGVRAVEIVRCRDCRHGHEAEWPKSWNIPADYLDCTGELVELWDYYDDQPNSNPVKPDGFCAWAERREQ